MAAEIESKQEQLVRSRKLAAIGTFSSGIAHELNNPLNNISLTADSLQEEYNTISEAEGREMIADIITQTDRASSVVRNLLDFCRETPPLQSLINIRDVVMGTNKLIKNQLRLGAIWFEEYIPETLPKVQGDFKELQQVFLNLFLNSIHAMEGGGLIHVEGMSGPPGYIKVEFSDTGIGISAEKIESVFDPFYTTKLVGQGTGLGLSIVYGIIKKHGGYIEVRSKVNVGTTFAIFLPIANYNSGSSNENGTGSSS
jgi:signal transduction histidine kinase